MTSLDLSIGAVLCVLLSVFLAHRLNESNTSKKQYKNTVTKFKNLFVPFLRELESDDSNPGLLVITNFAKHDEQARKLINTLPHHKVKKFKKYWLRYENLYESKKEMGEAIKIVSEVDDISKANDITYLYEQARKRRVEVINIINDAINSL